MKYLLPALLLAGGCGGAAVAPAPPVADEPPLLGCWNGGEILFRETTRTLGPGGGVRVIVIHESGAWHVDDRGRTRRGCLPPARLELLEAQLTTVRRARPDAPTCADTPTHDTLVEVPGVGAISYRWPCASGPDDATMTGIEAARDLTWRQPPNRG